jgi:hypothetical protein
MSQDNNLATRLRKVDMQTGTVSLLRKSQIQNTIVPPGDRGEQLIANLILSVAASQFNSDGAANEYISRAHALAQNLANQTLTFVRPSKFARLTCDQAGKTEIGLFSVINEILVLPTLSPESIPRNQLAISPVINVIDFEIVYFTLRLRTRRVLIALEAMKKMGSGEKLIDAAEHVLAECLHHEISSPEPIDRASDYITLAHNLIGKANSPLTALALQNDHNALDLYISRVTSSLLFF